MKLLISSNIGLSSSGPRTSCQSNKDCLSTNCTNNICVGLSKHGGYCWSNSDCLPDLKLSCDSGNLPASSGKCCNKLLFLNFLYRD